MTIQTEQPSAEDVIRALLRVLHPGAVGLIGNHHGADRVAQACQAIDAAKDYLGRQA